jgi:hypothetical protein
MSKLAKLDRFRQKVQAVVDHKTFAQRPEKAGLLVTTELNNALEECKARVARIAKDCRAKNKKFRSVLRPGPSIPSARLISLLLGTWSSTLSSTGTDACMVSPLLAMTHPTCNESPRSSTNLNSLSTVQTRMILFKACWATAGSCRRWQPCRLRRVWLRASALR